MRFEIKNRMIKRIDNDNDENQTIGDNADYEAEFTFDSEWDGHIKTARFIHNCKSVERILENDKCLIPVEVLKHGYLKVGVYTAEMTTTPCAIFVRPSIKETHGTTVEPTPDVYAQIIAMIENIEVQGVTDEQIEKAVAKYMEEHPITPPVVITFESITATKEKTEYNAGDTFDSTDIVVTASYSDGSTKDVTSSADINTANVNMDEAGSYSIGISYTENNVTKVTSIVIVVSAVAPEPEPEPSPIVPQSGTWQLKTTTMKKYVIFGTDDDNIGNPKFFRMLRTYEFPYTMNTESESASALKDLGNDVDTSIFNNSDAPSLFADGVNVVELGKYLHDNNLGEVAQHGASAKVLWDSSNLVGDFLTSLHQEYTVQGGTKTEEELRTAIMEQLADTDGSQGAVYVDESRAALESIYGFPIYTVGAWGGSPIATVDGIECNLNSIKGTSNYDWRGKNYTSVGSKIGSFSANVNTYDLSRITDGVDKVIEYIDMILPGKACEFFWHMPFNDETDISKWRTMFDNVKTLVDSNKVEVITRKQYAELGEYVDNPITSLSVTRNGSLNIGDTDSDDAYTITVSYADGNVGLPESDVILDRSAVNTETDGTYVVNAYYRGFTATANVVVMSSGLTLPDELKSTDYWFVYSNDSNGNWYCGNSDKAIVEAIITDNKLLQFNGTAGAKINGWKSSDSGVTWEQVTTNRTTWNGNISTNRTSDTDGGYQFNSQYNDDITWLETSGNFDITY